ncbi:MAG: hypothetical protein IPG45_27550 [Deltaproteobacteria bacterium]|nr:hypothetical protein [Deltaproteobacteria bacterium]
MRAPAWLMFLPLLSACSCEDEPEVLDSGPGDSGPIDVGADAGDGGRDLGPMDLGVWMDAQPSDANLDAGEDASESDGGAQLDAAPVDGAAPDSGIRGTCAGPEDCGGEACLTVPNGSNGWRTCAFDVVQEAVTCQGEFDGCCTSAQCTDSAGGLCVTTIPFYCSGPPPPFANLCLYDECGPNQACGNDQLCVPARAFGEPRAHCVPAECLDDSQCTSRAGGQCRPFIAPCRGRVSGFFCTYADSACVKNEDCVALQGGYCAPGTDGETECREFIPPP